MHDALGNAFVVEVGDLLAQDEVFQQRRPAQAGLQRILVVADGDTLVGGQHLHAAWLSARRAARAGLTDWTCCWVSWWASRCG
jgi:hypothetical protein